MRLILVTTNKIKQYRVIFTDGTTKTVYGRYGAHAWAVARDLWPDKCVCFLEYDMTRIDAVH